METLGGAERGGVERGAAENPRWKSGHIFYDAPATATVLGRIVVTEILPTPGRA